MPIFTGADLDKDTRVSCDVCVVGSGAGGAHVAARLSAEGKHVVVLEDGGFHKSRTFDMTESGMNPRLYQQSGARATADSSISLLQGRAVGGTTVVNWTTSFRTPERVLSFWAEHHGVEGLTHAALVPHWERIEERLSIHQSKLEEVNANNMVLWRGAKALGWQTNLLYRNVNRCAHTGYCGMGCPIDAKQSMLVTMIPEAVKAGADVYANAWVERVTQDGRTCKSVVARLRDPETDQPNGLTLTVEAKVVVLSGGAVNTPAVLLRSEINPNGRTGMRTFVHPVAVAVGIHPQRIDGFKGSPQYVHSDEFVDRGEHMGMLLEASPIFPVLEGAGIPMFGEELRGVMDQLPYLSNTIGLLHDGFDISDPDEGATVTLNSVGNPSVSYKWTPRLMEGLQEATRVSLRIQLAAGARQVRSGHPFTATTIDEVEAKSRAAAYGPNQVPVFSAHQMGGCAMGTDPSRSVVDSRTLRHHELDNLFVIDGSVMPTSASVNPQVTIYGIASWASEHVLHALG